MDRWSRLAPLTGVVYTGLILAAIFSQPNTPNSDASGRHVIAYFTAHRSGILASAFLGVFAALFLLFFAAALRAYLRPRSASDGLLTLGFGGAVLLTVGLSVLMALSFAVADVPNKLSPAAAQALNVIDNDLFFPFLLGASAFMIGNGLAILRSAALPRWLGGTAFVLGIISVTPVGWFAFLLSTLWVAAVSVLIYLRQGKPVGVQAAPQAEERVPTTA